MARLPLYKNIYNDIRDGIRTNKIAPSEQLLPEAKLAEEYGVSIITVRRAIHELVLDGLVESRQGVGSFVKDPEASPIVVGLSSFTSDVASGRLRLVRTLIEDKIDICPPDIADKLRVQAGSMVRTLVRLDTDGIKQISVDVARIPPHLAGDIDYETAASPLFMHMWQMNSQLTFVRTDYDIHVENATEEDIKLLDIDLATPMLCTDETVYDANDVPCVHVITRYRGDRCRLSGNVLLVQSDTPRGRVGE